jgi:ribosomal protein S18 acetylase RimI-like enzyme
MIPAPARKAELLEQVFEVSGDVVVDNQGIVWLPRGSGCPPCRFVTKWETPRPMDTVVSMVFSPAVEADYPAIVDLVNLAFRGFGPAASWNIESGIIEGKRLNESLLREDLAAKPGAHLLTHRDEADDALLGTVWLYPEKDNAWYLGLLTVRPDLQNRQLGRRLLSAAEDFAKGHGAACIRMTVVNVRDALIAWYERRGYTLTGETQPFPYGDERFGKPLRDDLHFVVLEKKLEG